MSCCSFISNPCTSTRNGCIECKKNPVPCGLMTVSFIAFAAIALTLAVSYSGLYSLPHPAFWGLAGACVLTFIMGSLFCSSALQHPKDKHECC